MSRVAVPPLTFALDRTPLTRLFRAGWLGFHVWDLDAPAVAIAWQLLFTRYLRVSVSWMAVLALALAVWLIYAGDRILDVRRSGPIQTTTRHAFHRRHRRTLTGIAAIALTSLVCISSLLRPPLAKAGYGLAGFVAIYLACVHLCPGPQRRWFPKELVVGILFAAGACLAPWCRAQNGSALLLPGLFFAALCWVNCVVIEVWEWRDSGSASTSHPHAWTLWLWRTLRPALTVLTLAAGCFYLAGLHPVFAAILLSSIAILLLDRFKYRLSTDVRRILADAALLTPILFLTLR